MGPGSIRADSWQRPLKFWEITPDPWRGFVAVHTTAPWALASAVVPEMTRQGWGRIVNVTTSLGTMLNAGCPTYGPSKAALEALSAIMAKDLDGTGVTVNVLVARRGHRHCDDLRPSGLRSRQSSRRLWCRRSSGSS
jgi:NAD(P)-dependent dehydrogenase (short-subunit alcohol dehydrogenase family)